MSETSAFGYPGISPSWPTSAKDGVGTALSHHSSVWFTVSHGIVNEVYYPRVDIANTRDIQFLVSSKGFFSEERKDTDHDTVFMKTGVPLFQIENKCKENRYVISKTVFTDPDSDVLIQRALFKPLKGKMSDYGLYLLIAPHIDNAGYGNNAWVGTYKGIPMLFASRNGIAMATCSNAAFGKMSCGYVGSSDLWQDVHSNGTMEWEFRTAMNGNVALGAEMLVRDKEKFSVYTGFGSTPEEAALKVRYTMMKSIDSLEQKYQAEWTGYLRNCGVTDTRSKVSSLYETSISVLKVHQAKQSSPGALIASLSIPWGSSKGDDDMGGYHLVWTRDMVESAMAQIAIGDFDGAVSAMRFLMVTQEADGRWPQNMWLDGSGYWKGIQLDEVAFPILLAARLNQIGKIESDYVWPMVRKAAEFLLKLGPSTQQDRWEEDGGLSPFTLAVEISGLLAAADFAEENDEPLMADVLRKRADYYNDRIEFWTYVGGSELAGRTGVDGYYVRIAPSDRLEEGPEESDEDVVIIKNRPDGQNTIKKENEISVDALALVRFGIRRPDDPRIVNTVKVIDATLKGDTPTGPIWHRYNGDGYGEHENGDAFDGTGIGRGWPLFSGERGHYELAAGRIEEAANLKEVMEKQTSPGGMLPEQVWDSPDIVEKGLRKGKPSGSAMPLVWAHSEYLKLCKSLRDGRVFDMPELNRERYLDKNSKTELFEWTVNNKLTWIPEGLVLRISLFETAKVIWTSDQWETKNEAETVDSGLGIYYADIPSEDLKKGDKIVFTIYWSYPERWEGTNFTVLVY